VTIFYKFAETKSFKFYVRILLMSCLCIAMPGYYMGVGPMIVYQQRNLHDESLVRIDTFLLGKFFPDGQLALAIDRSDKLNPSTTFGKICTEIFQFAYVSYYVWGYFLLGILALQYAYAYYKDQSPLWQEILWTRLKMCMCAWLGTYLINFLVNFLLPAVSPRVYLNDLFVHPLDGFGFAGFLREQVEKEAAGSFGTFPSGHVSVQWVTSFVAFRFVRWYGWLATIGAVLITLATLYLRYHYFIDVLGAIPLICFGIIFGGFFPDVSFEQISAFSKPTEDSRRLLV